MNRASRPVSPQAHRLPVFQLALGCAAAVIAGDQHEGALGVELAFLGRKTAAEVRNISQQGAGITCAERLAIQQPLRIVSGLLPEIRAKVRWRKDDAYGLAFDDTFGLGQLAAFAAGAQDPALLAVPGRSEFGRR